MRDLFTPSHRALHQFGGFHDLRPIDARHGCTGLAERFAADECAVEPDALGRIVEYGEGHPRTTMLIAQKSHLTTIELDAREIDLTIVEQGLLTALCGRPGQPRADGRADPPAAQARPRRRRARGARTSPSTQAPPRRGPPRAGSAARRRHHRKPRTRRLALSPAPSYAAIWRVSARLTISGCPPFGASCTVVGASAALPSGGRTRGVGGSGTRSAGGI